MSRGALAAALWLAFAVGAGCGSRDAPAPAHEAAPTRLRVALLPYLNNAALFIARDEGYFAAHGLDVEFVPLRLSATWVPALVTGDLDVLPGTITPNILNAAARGARVRLVADKGYYAANGCSWGALVVRRELLDEDGGIDLEGLQISSGMSHSSEYYLDRVLAMEGLPPESVTRLHLPTAAELDALARGRIDAAVLGEPHLTQVRSLSPDLVALFPTAEVTPDFQYSFVAYGPRLIDEDPDAGRRFLAAYLQGVRQYNEGKTPRNIEIIARETEIDPEVLRAACWPQVRSSGVIDTTSLMDFQEWAMEKGYLDQRVPLEEIWDPGFLAP